MICKTCGGRVDHAGEDMYYYCPSCQKMLDAEDVQAMPMGLPRPDKDAAANETGRKALAQRVAAGPFVLIALSLFTICNQFTAFVALPYGIYLLRCVRQLNDPRKKNQRHFILFWMVFPTYIAVMSLIALVRWGIARI